MSEVRDIRDLAQRAELEFHLKPRTLSRRAWMAGVVLALVCLGWVAVAGFLGNRRLYEAGCLSDSHAFIANDCAQCHTTWGPLNRLATLDSDTTSVRNSSIDNQLCLKCHAANEHHSNQSPAHSELSCAACHREHQGQRSLAEVTDRHCLKCHADLKTSDGSLPLFAEHVTGFDSNQGHPEFHLWWRLETLSSDEVPKVLLSDKELKQLKPSARADGTKPQALQDVLKSLKPGELGIQNSKSGLRDRTELKFNHATHFIPGRIHDQDGKPLDLAKDCRACHVPDKAGQYMLPVNYEAHCARCHPLWYDNDNRPGEVVPHEPLEIVRGFLTDKYTLAVLNSKDPIPLKEAPQPRVLPGRSPLDERQVNDLKDRLAQAERFTLNHTRQQQQGGCKYCHTLEQVATEELPRIIPPNQPERWLVHGQFDHASHRMLDCLKCHQDVTNSRPSRESDLSQAAADVLIPHIAQCQACHTSSTSSSRKANVDAKENPGQGIQQITVKSNCVMCHTYHRRDH